MTFTYGRQRNTWSQLALPQLLICMYVHVHTTHIYTLCPSYRYLMRIQARRGFKSNRLIQLASHLANFKTVNQPWVFDLKITASQYIIYNGF